jgi:hypothetical protein
VASYAGRGYVYRSTGGGADEMSLAATPDWTNYSLSAWVNLSNLTGGLAILGRAADSSHYYQLEVKRNSSGQPIWALSLRDGATVTTLASGSLSYTAGSWRRLRLTMNGATLTAESSTDGTNFNSLGTATDGRYGQGRVGLRAWGAAASFDDLLVQRI